MHTTLKTVVAIALMSAVYGLGYRHGGTRAALQTDLRITVEGSDSDMTLKASTVGETLTVSAMEVTVRNKVAPDLDAQFPHEYGTPCPLKDGDPATIVAQSDDMVILKVIEKSDDGLFQAGDRIVQETTGPGVARTVFYCPVGTLFTLDRLNVNLERVRHLSQTASRRQQQQIDQGERSRIEAMLDQANGR